MTMADKAERCKAQDLLGGESRVYYRRKTSISQQSIDHEGEASCTMTTSSHKSPSLDRNSCFPGGL